MTDNEIIKAFETGVRNCNSCSYGITTQKRKVLDLIHRQDAEIRRLNSELAAKDRVDDYDTACLRIARKELKTANKEVQHGFWILLTEPDGKPHCYTCSICDNNSPYVETTSIFNYCPNCGAKMDLTTKK